MWQMQENNSKPCTILQYIDQIFKIKAIQVWPEGFVAAEDAAFKNRKHALHLRTLHLLSPKISKSGYCSTNSVRFAAFDVIWGISFVCLSPGFWVRINLPTFLQPFQQVHSNQMEFGLFWLLFKDWALVHVLRLTCLFINLKKLKFCLTD